MKKRGPKPRPLADRFWEKVKKGDGCWEWQGAKDDEGRGYIGRAPIQPRRAAPVSWEMANGVPVPHGMHVCHKCDNPSCVRPDHLFLGTPKDNMQDKVQKGRHPTTLCAAQVLEIRAAWPSVSKSRLAARYGVTKSCISHVVKRRGWKHI